MVLSGHLCQMDSLFLEWIVWCRIRPKRFGLLCCMFHFFSLSFSFHQVHINAAVDWTWRTNFNSVSADWIKCFHYFPHKGKRDLHIIWKNPLGSSSRNFVKSVWGWGSSLPWTNLDSLTLICSVVSLFFLKSIMHYLADPGKVQHEWRGFLNLCNYSKIIKMNKRQTNFIFEYKLNFFLPNSHFTAENQIE